MRIIDHAWSTPAEDGSKDRLKFSLADRTQDMVVGRPRASADGGGGAAAGGEQPPQARRADATDVGLQLIDNTTAGLGVVVLHVVDGLPAAQAGLEVGHVIQSVDGELAWDHKSTLKRISSIFAANGEVRRTIVRTFPSAATATSALGIAINDIGSPEPTANHPPPPSPPPPGAPGRRVEEIVEDASYPDHKA